MRKCPGCLCATQAPVYKISPYSHYKLKDLNTIIRLCPCEDDIFQNAKTSFNIIVSMISAIGNPTRKEWA
ncbi:hypothetical protein RclHR1_07690017 [Rhizophagus clarus]|uniref:Uncharacterized protein n=1 Tax=Rhizophagus clarus TaxID=94130 RepID=A0A2Z6S4E6_9GLOM|nr:hypothetical protein RclHR1_07690017 [Rhizophagus clarus]